MKIFDFEYTKKGSDEKSERKVLSLHASDGWVDGVDFTKLSEDEITQVKTIQLEYEKKMKPFMDKAFRRFLKEGMIIKHEETIK